MAQRKINQDIEKCFKQVAIGVEAFDAQYEKYEQSTNASQRDKLVDNIKKECKKLQRLRDQIKTWAAGNEVKDKTKLQEHRELIETKMEAFKAVEKEMKTKAFSKEGLMTSAKLDPKEREKEEMAAFLSDMVEELGRQIESVEAEAEQLHVQTKKIKKDTGKAERLAELEHRVERHKWHQAKLELLMRALANDGVEPEQVKGIEGDIREYIENNSEVDFYEDEALYDDLNLDEEEGKYGVHHDLDRTSSHDNQSVPEDIPEPPPSSDLPKAKVRPTTSESATIPTRRPSQQIKSPLPALATLHTVSSSATVPVSNNMKLAPPPTKPGETLKYASAAAAAAANDAAGIGITPLPAPPGKLPSVNPASVLPLGSTASGPSGKSSNNASPVVTSAQPVANNQEPKSITVDKPGQASSKRSPSRSRSSVSARSLPTSATHVAVAVTNRDSNLVSNQNGVTSRDSQSQQDGVMEQDHSRPLTKSSRKSHQQLDETASTTSPEDEEYDDIEAIYHLPASLQEIVDSFEAARNTAPPIVGPETQRILAAAFESRPDASDSERPRLYKPQNPSIFTPPHYPQEPLAIFDDPRLYSKIDTDALFYSFYYRQGTYQQYLAAKALKDQSWRFHKQYKTWFQRHEEPKNITEEYEQGTYRFFDYESTWMNRRKADFQFAYKFLEDDL